MAWVAGFDGCKKGWIAVLLETETREVRTRFVEHISGIDALPEMPVVVGVDMPIGLAVDGGREADTLARRLLGVRSSSIFSAPTRPALLYLEDYRAACDENVRCSGRGLSKQSFALFRKLAEVDAYISPEKQERVREVHPELSFLEMNGGRPLRHAKKTAAGVLERMTLLREHDMGDVARLNAEAEGLDAGGFDDLLDATAASWSAERCLRLKAIALPEQAHVGGRGLKMQIWR